jgi:Soluble lytic murein transglycosylase and related regulatory proteins (some contain LysM/invasin domains)
MIKKIKPAIMFVGGLLIGAGVIAGLAFRETNKDEGTVNVKEDGRLQYKWYVPETPKAISFAGERVPLERWDVKEQFERELLYNYYAQYSTLYILRLSTRFFPMIEQKLKENGIPDDFKYLCVAESALRNQTSSAGAVGFWQFMRDTAPRYGIEISNDVDERYHVEKSTEAACKYLREAYNKFGSWTAAAASYNCGMAGYNKFSSFQQTNDYYNLLLPEETMRYIFRILAFKYIIGEAHKIGFIMHHTDAYKPYKTRPVTVDTTITDLAQFAISNGTNYRMLKTLNPWLREKSLTVKAGKTYTILLPASN